MRDERVKRDEPAQRTRQRDAAHAQIGDDPYILTAGRAWQLRKRKRPGPFEGAAPEKDSARPTSVGMSGGALDSGEWPSMRTASPRISVHDAEGTGFGGFIILTPTRSSYEGRAISKLLAPLRP